MKIFATLIIIRYNKIIKTRLWFHRLWLFYFCVVIKKCWYSFFGWWKLSKTNPQFFCFFEGGGISGENKNEMPSQDLTVQCTVNITRKDPVLVKARLRPPSLPPPNTTTTTTINVYKWNSLKKHYFRFPWLTVYLYLWILLTTI